MTTDNGEFKGSTKQALVDIKEDVKEIQVKVDSLSNRFWVIVLLLVVAIVEKIPQLVNLVLAK